MQESRPRVSLVTSSIPECRLNIEGRIGRGDKMHKILASRRERQLLLLGDAYKPIQGPWPPKKADVGDLHHSSKEFYPHGGLKPGGPGLSEKWISANDASKSIEGARTRERPVQRRAPGTLSEWVLEGEDQGPSGKDPCPGQGTAPALGSASAAEGPGVSEREVLRSKPSQLPRNWVSKRKEGIVIGETGWKLEGRLIEGRPVAQLQEGSGRQEGLIELGKSVEEQTEKALAQLEEELEKQDLRDPPGDDVYNDPGEARVVGSFLIEVLSDRSTQTEAKESALDIRSKWNLNSGCRSDVRREKHGLGDPVHGLCTDPPFRCNLLSRFPVEGRMMSCQVSPPLIGKDCN
jgi:hypothetical protein